MFVQVSWLRRRGPEMSLLTTNQLVFSVDTRLGVTRWGTVVVMMMMMMMMMMMVMMMIITGRGTTGVW